MSTYKQKMEQHIMEKLRNGEALTDEETAAGISDLCYEMVMMGASDDAINEVIREFRVAAKGKDHPDYVSPPRMVNTAA